MWQNKNQLYKQSKKKLKLQFNLIVLVAILNLQKQKLNYSYDDGWGVSEFCDPGQEHEDSAWKIGPIT